MRKDNRTNNKVPGFPKNLIKEVTLPKSEEKIMATPKKKKPKETIHGHRIKPILDEIGMSQAEFADIAFDGDAAYASRIINGQRKCLSLPIAFKIAKALDRSIEEIFMPKRQ